MDCQKEKRSILGRNHFKGKKRLEEIENKSEKFAGQLRKFKNKTEISLNWKSNMLNLLENAIEPDLQKAKTITVKIEQTGEKYQFEKSNGKWKIPNSCTEI